jgi:hypothetical protein
MTRNPLATATAVVVVMVVCLARGSPDARAQDHGRVLSRRDLAGIGAQGTDGRTNPEEFEGAPPPFLLAYRIPYANRPVQVPVPGHPVSPVPSPQPGYSYPAPQLYYYTYHGYTYYCWAVPQVSYSSPAVPAGYTGR